MTAEGRARDQAEHAAGIAQDATFYIAAREPQHRPRKVLKHNDTFALIDEHGDIGAIGSGPEGIFDSDTRFLSRLEVLFAGMSLLRLGGAVTADNSCLHVDLTTPDLYCDGVLQLAKDQLHVSRMFYIGDGALWHRLRITNHGAEPISGPLAVCFDGDFTDIFELRGIRRAERGRIEPFRCALDRSSRRYTGLDAVERRVEVSFDPAPRLMAATVATYDLALRPKETLNILNTVRCFTEGRSAVVAPATPHAARGARRRLLHDGARLSTSNTALNEVLRRGRSDLAMLTTMTEQGAFPYAGIPWFSTTFGRDAIITAMQMLWLQPSLARGVLNRLATLQATAVDHSSDAEPGKIVHEIRNGEMAACGEVPFGRYYGSVDATPLFLMLLGMYEQRCGDDGLVRGLRPTSRAALDWLGAAHDRGEGLITYARSSADGLQNQGWKDSSDAVFHRDGRLASAPIALIEVQAYAVAAWRAAARFSEGHSPSEAAQYTARADRLAELIEKRFWSDEFDCYALAIDGSGHSCDVVTSNAGHCLFTGLCEQDRGVRLGRRLMAADMHSGWGVRTVSSRAPRYNPMSYHNGSVWPHDTAMVAAGLCRYGLQNEGVTLFDGLAQSAMRMDHGRLPELFCGFARRTGRGPTAYPVACSPQAWASGALFMMLGALIGIEIDPRARVVLFRAPTLPTGVDELIIEELAVGEGSVDVALRRTRRGTSLTILRSRGGVHAALGEPRPIGVRA